MKVILVTAKYDSKANGVRETRAGTVGSIKNAQLWLDHTPEPAMIYIDGAQNFDGFNEKFCAQNRRYAIEYKKIKD